MLLDCICPCCLPSVSQLLSQKNQTEQKHVYHGDHHNTDTSLNVIYTIISSLKDHLKARTLKESLFYCN